MLDNLREDANASPFFDDEDEFPDFEEKDEEEKAPPKTDYAAVFKPVLVLTPLQRFILAALFFIVVCILGAMFLMVTGKFSVF